MLDTFETTDSVVSLILLCKNGESEIVLCQKHQKMTNIFNPTPTSGH